MPDWTHAYKDPGDPPPGKINPPSPDEIQPTDPGWSTYVRAQTDKTGLKWTHDCSVSLEVESTGKSMVWPIDGDNPTDYAADKDWGWKEDRTYETQPPEEYQDFTRWVRHYPKMRTQKYSQYRATVYVRCGSHFVNTLPDYFWVPDGQPITGAVDVYMWTATSGMKTGEDGKKYKWTTTGKKTPPPAQDPVPDAWIGDNETPPYWIVHPIDWKPELKFDLKLRWDLKLRYDWMAPRAMPFDPGSKSINWFRIGDVFGGPGSKRKNK